MSHKHLLLSNGPKRVYLISENGQFEVNLAGKTVVYQESTERYWLYLLLQKKSYQEFAREVRASVRLELSPNEISQLAEDFIAAHKIEDADHYSFQMLPKQAGAGGLLLPIPGHTCIISSEDEDKLLSILVANPNALAKTKIAWWFKSFCNNYGYDFQRKCHGMQYDYLMESFLEQEGVEPDKLPPVPSNQQQGGMTDSAISSMIRLVLMLIVCPAMFIGGVKICDLANSFFGMALGVIVAGIGILLFGCAIGWYSFDEIFKNKQ